jgi:hypothetical protein
MKGKKSIGLSLACCLVVLNVVILHSAAWGECTVQERIELGKHGYNKEEVGKMCEDDGGNFWEALTKDVINNLAKGATDSLTKSLNNALVGRERESTTSSQTSEGARVCITDVGVCPPQSGTPIGARCYCQAWDGTPFVGFSR